MTSYQYTRIDGQRVEKNVAAAFKKWATDFQKETGCSLHVTSGTRTVAEQQKLRDAYVSGRSKVVAAIPSESSHCEIGPSGPRALDIHDSGKDAGVTVKGTHRWNIAVTLGKKYGFTWGGWGVPASEGWHFENHVVKVGVYPKPAPALLPTQRKATALTNRRKSPDTKSAPMKDPLKKGVVGNFVGWKHGQKVEGNDIWFKGVSGNWFWSGCLGGPNTKGLKEIK